MTITHRRDDCMGPWKQSRTRGRWLVCTRCRATVAPTRAAMITALEENWWHGFLHGLADLGAEEIREERGW